MNTPENKLIALPEGVKFTYEPIANSGGLGLPLVLSIVYFIVITPIGLLLRIFGKDLLGIKFLKKKSYWIKRDKDLGSMKNQF